ncbi:hypothetical protein O6H91_03G029200 [Diphasiastrum complanatum]|uniref:Uncharacterized protein n=1 Tax=Diphasiastrum complanatum TaxID=34168 RepID=A0ACC2E4Y6_DIPCM|nr:hypothetical protein O6H91_03G029200 [Diphasiastrum complanatum]
MNASLLMSKIAIGINFCLIMAPAVTFASVNPPPTIITSSPEPSTNSVSFCNKSASFQNNSVFGRNLNILLKALLNDTPSPSEMLKKHVQGIDPDKAYGYSQCFFTTVSHGNCSLCIERAVQQIAVECAHAIDVTLFYDDCRVGYGARDKSSDIWEFFNPVLMYDTFRQNLKKVWSMIRQEAPLTKKPVAFAYGATPLDMAFGCAQCYNLSESDCIAQFDGLFNSANYTGARFMAPDQFFRYETSSFFTGHVSLLVVILTTIIGGCTLLLVCIFLLLFIKNRHPKLFGSSKVVLEHPSTETKFFKGCLMFSYEALRDATKDFLQENKLGQGSYGVVYKGILYDGSEVAIKHLSRHSTQGNEEFVNEVAIITSIQHKNLVKLKGCCIEGEERLLVYEYMDHKSLDLSLFGTHVLNWKTRYNITVGIASAINYLHEESEPRILHRNIKVSKILLDINFQPKISDFVLARLFPEEQSFIDTTTFLETTGYLAPEATHGHLTEKVDVFSFGVLLFEIISGRKNQEIGLQNETLYIVDKAFRLCEEGRLLELVDPRLEGDYPEDQATNLINIAMLCVQGDAFRRPKMSNVVAMLLDYATIGSPMLQNN